MEERVVCTLIIGDEAERLAVYAIPLMENYAKKVNADFYILRGGRQENASIPYYEKFQIIDLLKRYKRLIFLDIDVLVTPIIPDLFTVVPGDSFGVVNVSLIFDNIEREVSVINEVYNYSFDHTKYFNTGVMVMSSGHSFLFDRDCHSFSMLMQAHKKGLKFMYDQTYLNYYAQANSVKLLDLGAAYNFTRAWGGNWKRFGKFAIHYAGLKGPRGKFMRRDYQIINNKILFSIFSFFPFVPFVVDRFWVLMDRFRSSLSLGE